MGMPQPTAVVPGTGLLVVPQPGLNASPLGAVHSADDTHGEGNGVMGDSADLNSDRARDDERWLTVNGRRWRRTDPCLPADVVDALTSQLGRGRSAVKSARKSGDDALVADARRRVGLAKHGLGERGPYWWDEPEADRIARARTSLIELEALDRNE
jgi:hypothetical protein